MSGAGQRLIISCCTRNFSTSFKLANKSSEYDIIIVGGGIVGVSAARELLQRHRNLRMAVVEKEHKLALHQSGHNSGVIHAGIYYKPGSLKAKLCVEGMHLCYKYLDEKQIPYKKVGKLIVATNTVEVERLNDLYERGLKNQVADLKFIEGEEIRKIEPNCKGLKALWSPHTGIVDFGLVTENYGEDFKNCGGHIHLNFEVNKLTETTDPDYPVTLNSVGGRSLKSKYVLTCAGLHSDKLAILSGCSVSPKIVPFRGEYLLLDKSKCNLVKGNIYPVPDPRFPFLGVHFTPRIDGNVWLGPNAVLAFRREGYKWSDINFSELIESVRYSGFQKLAFKYTLSGVQEILKSVFVSLQVKELQKFIPELTVKDVTKGPTGVRAQAVDDDGNLMDDFLFDMGEGQRVLHCRNAPSPGATSSLAIAKMVADTLEKKFKIN